jgi:hypothetical protein
MKAAYEACIVPTVGLHIRVLHPIHKVFDDFEPSSSVAECHRASIIGSYATVEGINFGINGYAWWLKSGNAHLHPDVFFARTGFNQLTIFTISRMVAQPKSGRLTSLIASVTI